MRFLKKLKSGNFWVSLISCGVLIAEVVFDFEIKTEYLNQILLGLMGLLTVCGIVTDHGATETLIANLSSSDDQKQENNQENISNIKSICDTISLMLNKVSINPNNEKTDKTDESINSANTDSANVDVATTDYTTNNNTITDSTTADYSNPNNTNTNGVIADSATTNYANVNYATSNCSNADSVNICQNDDNDNEHTEGEQVNKSDALQESIESNPTAEITTQYAPEQIIDIVNK